MFKQTIIEALEADGRKVAIQVIKEEIESGRYQINDEHIAQKILEYAPMPIEEEAVVA